MLLNIYIYIYIYIYIFVGLYTYYNGIIHTSIIQLLKANGKLKF